MLTEERKKKKKEHEQIVRNIERKMAVVKKELTMNDRLFKCSFCDFATGTLKGIDIHVIDKHGADL